MSKINLLSLLNDTKAKSFKDLAKACKVNTDKEKEKLYFLKKEEYEPLENLSIEVEKGQRYIFNKKRKSSLEKIISEFDMRQVRRVRVGMVKGDLTKTKYVWDGQGTAFAMACLGFKSVPIEICVFENHREMRQFFRKQQDGVKALDEWDQYFVNLEDAKEKEVTGQEMSRHESKALDIQRVLIATNDIAYADEREDITNRKSIPFGIVRRAIQTSSIFYGNNPIKNNKIVWTAQGSLQNNVLIGVMNILHKHFPKDTSYMEKLTRLCCSWVSCYAMGISNIKEEIGEKTSFSFVSKEKVNFSSNMLEALKMLDFYISKAKLLKQKQKSLYDHIFKNERHGGNNDADVEGRYLQLHDKIEQTVELLSEEWEKFQTDKK
jgi:hypothetical protein